MSLDVMGRVWQRSQHEGTYLLALLALADWANDDGVCWYKVERLADRARVTVRQTQSILAELEESGELYRRIGGGRGNKSIYIVLTGMDEATIAAILEHHIDDLSPQEAQRIAQQKVQRASPFLRKGEVQRAERVKPSARKGEVQRTERVKSSVNRGAVNGSPKGRIDPDPSLTIPLTDPPTDPPVNRAGVVLEKLVGLLGNTNGPKAFHRNPDLLPAEVDRLSEWCERNPDGKENPKGYAFSCLMNGRLPYTVEPAPTPPPTPAPPPAPVDLDAPPAVDEGIGFAEMARQLAELAKQKGMSDGSTRPTARVPKHPYWK